MEKECKLNLTNVLLIKIYLKENLISPFINNLKIYKKISINEEKCSVFIRNYRYWVFSFYEKLRHTIQNRLAY